MFLCFLTVFTSLPVLYGLRAPLLWLHLLAALLRCDRASRVLTDLAAAWVVGHGFVYLQITFKFFFFLIGTGGSSTGI